MQCAVYMCESEQDSEATTPQDLRFRRCRDHDLEFYGGIGCCVVPYCIKSASGSGLCGMHNSQVRRSGAVSSRYTAPKPDLREKVGGEFTEVYYNKIRGRIESYTSKDDVGCWIWQRSKFYPMRSRYPDMSYGKLSFRGKSHYAHRVSYIVFKGEIPDTLTIDHLCRNTLCVNPEHLEAVTQRVNNLRAPRHLVHGNAGGDGRGLGRKAGELCISRGHEYERTDYGVCRHCDNWRKRKYYAKKRGEG